MRRISEKELKEAIASRKPGERLCFAESEIWDMDLTGMDLSNMDFTLCSFQNTTLCGVSFADSTVENALFDGCPLRITPRHLPLPRLSQNGSKESGDGNPLP